MNCRKLGLIYKHDEPNSWWNSHTMAPTAILINESIIRIFIGCWDKNKISRIGYIDVCAKNPLKIKNISKNSVLSIGADGSFDENGVFPGHANIFNGKVFLYYTGFQLGIKVRHFNFGGLAISHNEGKKFSKVSNVPILDRQNEGYIVRAGQSSIKLKKKFLSVYSAGSKWIEVNKKLRPVYDIYLQYSKDGINYKKSGEKILENNLDIEHGLGRPQIIKLKKNYFIFYTRRMLNMKYNMGYATSNDLVNWKRIDDINLHHSNNSWDSNMIYFPSICETKEKVFLFYCGNNFGEEGIGVAELYI